MKKTIVKMLSVILVVVMTITAAPLSGLIGVELPKWADTSLNAEAAVADDIISTARNQKGSYESDINKFTTWFYGKSTSAAWCAIFVSWCANQVGVLNDAIPKNANCASMMAWFKNRGEYHSVSSDYVPQKGDVIFFDTDGSGVTHHVEFVAQSGFITENGKTKVKCIGGNTSNSSFNGSDYVAEKNRYIYQSSCKVMGYAHPSYGTENDYSQNTYSFTFNANGGTLGSAESFSTKYGNDFQILNTTCTRSGYTWAGWNVKRNNDNKWYVDGQGWCTESQISSNGYIKKVYSNYQNCKLDDSWTSGISGDCSYTFYAIWIQSQSRETKIKVFFSPYGSGYDHLTAMNNQTTSGFTQERIYVWYVIYDNTTGNLFNTYSDKTYSVEMDIYDPNGDLVYDTTYNDNDANWIYMTPQMSGAYKVSVKLSGQIWTETPTTVTYDVSYDAELISSADDSVSLNLNGTNSQTITIDVVGSYPGEKDATVYTTSGYYSMDECYWSNGKIYITLRGLKTGTTSVKVELYEKYTGNKNVVATKIIPVTITANTYTISYNANGGSGAPSSQTKYYGTDITLSSTVPMRSGYTFLGWSTSSTATSATYQPGSTFSSNADTTLYAVWKANPTYSITYNANGGTGAPSTQTGSTNYTISSTVPTRFGYTFLGWAVSSSATSSTYEAGDTVAIGGNLTLYAVWKAATTLAAGTTYTSTVSFANQEIYYVFTPSSTGEYTFESTGSVDSRVYVYNSSGTEIGYDDDSSDEGYNFKLSMDLTGGTKYYVKIRAYNNNTGTISFKATKNVYTLSYNANGGSGVPESQTGSTSYTISSTIPTRFGYTFLGWSKSSSATTATYIPGDAITLTSDTTLYAVWKSATAISELEMCDLTIEYTGQYVYYSFIPSKSTRYMIGSVCDIDSRVYVYDASGNEIARDDDSGQDNNFLLYVDLTAGTKYYIKVNAYGSETGEISFLIDFVKYSISYDANGGTGAPSSQVKNHAITLTLSSAKPTKTGYTFLGWSTSSTATSATYQPGGSFTTNANTTLYAVWKANTYTIKYNANGGSGTMSNSSHTYDVSKALTSNAFTRSGYTFLGWSTNSSATTATYTNGQSVKNLTSTNGDTVNLYAVWSKIPTYTISYNANGGSGAPSSQTKTKDVTLTLSTTTPFRTGYTFLGWSTSSTATSATYQSGGSFTNNADTTLYAVWKANTYSVKYNANGGSGTMSNSSHTYDVSKSLTLYSGTRSGYTFLGWSTNSSATTATYTNGQSVKNLTSTNGDTVNLYAVWSKIPTYTVSYNANGGSNAPSSQTKTKDVTLTLSSTKPTKTGCTFTGWNTKADGTGTSYASGASYTSNAAVTLYAQWRANTYTVKYNANGGSGTMSNSSHTYDVSKALTSNEFTRSGYTFLGWSTSSSATTATYTDGQSVKNLTSTDGATVNLYAVWQEIEPEVMLGDVNGDDVIDAGDAVIISRYDAGLITLTQDQLVAADINKDGYVDAGDAVIISRYDAGLIDSLS